MNCESVSQNCVLCQVQMLPCRAGVEGLQSAMHECQLEQNTAR